MEDELNLIDYWHIIWKYKWLIGGIFVISAAAVMFYSFSLPRTYKATATILPPLEGSTSNGLDVLRSAGIGKLSPKVTPTEIFIGILKSRQMLDDTVDRFNLMENYTGTRESARRMLSANTEIKLSREQMIQVSFTDESPERAAETANFYVQNLDKLNSRFNITKAGQTRKFIEARLEETKRYLKEAENALESYRVRNKVAGGIYSASVSAGGLEGSLIAKKVQLEARKKYMTEDNPETIKLENEISEIEKALEKMPPVENELARLIRYARAQENVYQLLVSQYEQAKIEEARDTPTVQVLDWAVVPEQKYGPRIKHNMLVSGIVALFAGLMLSFGLDYRNHYESRKQKD